MVIIIDAYNVLKQRTSDFITQEKRDAFINAVARYARIKNHNPIIVFDGGELNRPEKYTTEKHTIIYSGRSESADDVIKDLLEDCRPDNTLLVTRDHVLCTQAHKRRIPTIDPDAFMLQVEKKAGHAPEPLAHKDTQAHKRPGHVSSSEVDALMAHTEEILYKDESAPELARNPAHRPAEKKPSKQEKLLIAVIKKL